MKKYLFFIVFCVSSFVHGNGFNNLKNIQDQFYALIYQAGDLGATQPAPEVPYIAGLLGSSVDSIEGSAESRHIYEILYDKVPKNRARKAIAGIDQAKADAFDALPFDFTRYDKYQNSGHSVLGVAAQEAVEVVSAPSPGTSSLSSSSPSAGGGMNFGGGNKLFAGGMGRLKKTTATGEPSPPPVQIVASLLERVRIKLSELRASNSTSRKVDEKNTDIAILSELADELSGARMRDAVQQERYNKLVAYFNDLISPSPDQNAVLKITVGRRFLQEEALEKFPQVNGVTSPSSQLDGGASGAVSPAANMDITKQEINLLLTNLGLSASRTKVIDKGILNELLNKLQSAGGGESSAETARYNELVEFYELLKKQIEGLSLNSTETSRLEELRATLKREVTIISAPSRAEAPLPPPSIADVESVLRAAENKTTKFPGDNADIVILTELLGELNDTSARQRDETRIQKLVTVFRYLEKEVLSVGDTRKRNTKEAHERVFVLRKELAPQCYTTVVPPVNQVKVKTVSGTGGNFLSSIQALRAQQGAESEEEINKREVGNLKLEIPGSGETNKIHKDILEKLLQMLNNPTEKAQHPELYNKLVSFYKLFDLGSSLNKNMMSVPALHSKSREVPYELEKDYEKLSNELSSRVTQKQDGIQDFLVSAMRNRRHGVETQTDDDYGYDSDDGFGDDAKSAVVRADPYLTDEELELAVFLSNKQKIWYREWRDDKKMPAPVSVTPPSLQPVAVAASAGGIGNPPLSFLPPPAAAPGLNVSSSANSLASGVTTNATTPFSGTSSPHSSSSNLVGGGTVGGGVQSPPPAAPPERPPAGVVANGYIEADLIIAANSATPEDSVTDYLNGLIAPTANGEQDRREYLVQLRSNLNAAVSGFLAQKDKTNKVSQQKRGATRRVIAIILAKINEEIGA